MVSNGRRNFQVALAFRRRDETFMTSLDAPKPDDYHTEILGIELSQQFKTSPNHHRQHKRTKHQSHPLSSFAPLVPFTFTLMPSSSSSPTRRITRSSARRRSASPQPRIGQLTEEANHQATTEAAHALLYQERMDDLRALIHEIRADDWKYSVPERRPAHVTQSLAWKQEGSGSGSS